MELPYRTAHVRQTYRLVSKLVFEKGEVGERGNFKCPVLKKPLKRSSQNLFKCLEQQKKKNLLLILWFCNFTIKLNGGPQGMFIKYRNAEELREPAII